MSTTETVPTTPPAEPAVVPLVRLQGIKKHFPITQGIIFQHKIGAVHAVDGVDLEIYPGETLGLVGETGCGKSTLARVVMRLFGVTEGTIWFDGRDVTNLKGNELRELRRDMQMVFQDPYASLNPRKTVGSIIGAPFRLHGTVPKNRVKAEVQELMELVGLNPEHTTGTRTSSREASGSGSASRDRSRSGRSSSFVTSPSRRSMCRSRPRSSTCSRTSRASSI